MSCTSLLRSLGSCNIDVAGLDTQHTSWWIRHPQAHSKHWNYSTLILSIPVINYRLALLCSGARVGSQRKRPRCAFPLFSAVLRLPNPPLLELNKGTFLMIHLVVTTLNPFITIRSLLCGGAI